MPRGRKWVMNAMELRGRKCCQCCQCYFLGLLFSSSEFCGVCSRYAVGDGLGLVGLVQSQWEIVATVYGCTCSGSNHDN